MVLDAPIHTRKAPARSVASRLQLTDAPTSPVNVLVIEDDVISANALRIILTRRGCAVQIASSLADATTAMDESIPSVVLLDLLLPDGDGLDVLRVLRERDAKAKVIVMTGVHDPDHLLAARQLRPHAILHKPVYLPDLLRVLEC